MMDPTSADPPLRKPVNTLAIVPTKSSKITVLARKAYNVLLYLAQEQGIDHEVYRAPLQSVLRGIDFNSHAREIVKQHLRAMVSTTVEWQSAQVIVGSAILCALCRLVSGAVLVVPWQLSQVIAVVLSATLPFVRPLPWQ